MPSFIIHNITFVPQTNKKMLLFFLTKREKRNPLYANTIPSYNIQTYVFAAELFRAER